MRCFGHSSFAQPLREQGGDGGSHDAARRHPRQKQLLVARQGAAGRRDGHSHGSHEQHQGRDDSDAAPAELAELRHPDIGGEEDEEHADEQRRELLLELHQFGESSGFDVADDDPSDRHGDDAAFVEHLVAELEEQKHERQDEHVLETFRYEAAQPQKARHEKPAKGADGASEGQPEQEILARHPPRRPK